MVKISYCINQFFIKSNVVLNGFLLNFLKIKNSLTVTVSFLSLIKMCM